MLIYIIRHGETDSNVNRITNGWMDEGLNENGVKLAHLSGEGMKGIYFDECITSPLKRAMDTVNIVLQDSGNAGVKVETDDRLKEINFGINNGLSYHSGNLPEEEIGKFFSDPFEFPGYEEGERIEDVCRRTQEFLKELCDRDNGKPYLVGTHGCAMRAMLNLLYEDPSDFWQGQVPYNCAVNIIEASKGKIRLKERDKIFYDSRYIIDRYKR